MYIHDKMALDQNMIKTVVVVGTVIGIVAGIGTVVGATATLNYLGVWPKIVSFFPGSFYVNTKEDEPLAESVSG